MADVFISYSHDDNDFARALRQSIESFASVWLDENELMPADDFSEKIKDAVQNTACTIVIWTNNSLESPWVHREAAIAEVNNRLIQVCVGAGPPRFHAKHQCVSLPNKVPIADNSFEFIKLKTVIKRRIRERRWSVIVNRSSLFFGIIAMFLACAAIYLASEPGSSASATGNSEQIYFRKTFIFWAPPFAKAIGATPENWKSIEKQFHNRLSANFGGWSRWTVEGGEFPHGEQEGWFYQVSLPKKNDDMSAKDLREHISHFFHLATFYITETRHR
jgi:hypothetical protein